MRTQEVTQLRGGVTRKPSTGAGSYAVTQLRGVALCVRVGMRGRVCMCACMCEAWVCNRVTA